MTKLEAVTKVLAAAGQRPPGSLDTGGSSDASEAERLLDEIDLEVQSLGWHFNTVDKETFSPNGSNQIVLGTHIIRADGYSLSPDLTVRGVLLVDRSDNTTTNFTSSVELTYVYRASWGCIPNEVQDWIAAEAALRFVEQRVNRTHPQYPVLRQRAHRNALEKKTHAWQGDIDQSDLNLLSTRDSIVTKGDRMRRSL